MKKIILLILLVIGSVTLKANYIPAPLDYVLPQSFQYFPPTPYVDWNAGTGYTCPYCNYLYWVNKRCQVLYTVTIEGQLYAQVKYVGTNNSTLWPVNYVTMFGTNDYLIKTI